MGLQRKWYKLFRSPLLISNACSLLLRNKLSLRHTEGARKVLQSAVSGETKYLSRTAENSQTFFLGFAVHIILKRPFLLIPKAKPPKKGQIAEFSTVRERYVVAPVITTLTSFLSAPQRYLKFTGQRTCLGMQKDEPLVRKTFTVYTLSLF